MDASLAQALQGQSWARGPWVCDPTSGALGGRQRFGLVGTRSFLNMGSGTASRQCLLSLRSWEPQLEFHLWVGVGWEWDGVGKGVNRVECGGWEGSLSFF